MGFWDGSGTSWTICKQSALRFRQITTPTLHQQRQSTESMTIINVCYYLLLDIRQRMLMIAWTVNNVAELQAVFAVFDRDSDGFISMDEVTAVLASMGFRASPEYISDIFRQVDLDGMIVHSVLFFRIYLNVFMVRMLFLLMSFKTSCIDFVIFCSYLRDAMLLHVLALCLSVCYKLVFY